MNLDNYTRQLQEALDYATALAKKMKYDYIGSEHLLAGLTSVRDSVAAVVLKNRKVTLEEIVDKMAGSARADAHTTDKPELSPRAIALLAMAEEEKEICHEDKTGTEHLLIAIIRDEGCSAGLLLESFGLDLKKVLLDIIYAIGEDTGIYKDILKKDNASRDTDTPVLNKYGRDFTKLAVEGKLEPVIGREKEIERLIQILSRKRKNNPCLVGEAGVGKTAIVEGLARKIAAGDVPFSLQEKRLISLELSGVVAGTKYRGEFEERIQNIIKEVADSGQIILFVDEIHTLIGAGGAEGALDASNILKPALSRGEIQMVGATTQEEYRKYIEKDKALERRFQPVTVEEPSVEDTVMMLEGIVDGYERHHKVSISEDAIEAAAKLSARYINDRFLPDKAIDLLDEAAAKAGIQAQTQPKTLVRLEEEIMDLERQKEEVIQNEQFDELSQIMKKQDSKKKQYYKKRQKWLEEGQEKRIVVTENDIAALVSKWTGIPVEKIAQGESDRLLKLEENLHKRVVGQNEAVEAVAKAIRRGRVGIKEPNRPIGSFLFLGPTGVGKTELCKTLAEAVFGTEDAIIRVDMSEYMEKHSVSKLIGSPPGYVGYDEGGQLCEKIRRHPFSVVLFDEIEKAHPDVFNILLQVLDDGVLTDAHGKKVNFQNTILIMTSNVGANRIMEPKNLGFATQKDEKADYEKMKNAVMEEVKQLFRPEFINRIDEIIVFHPLNEKEVGQIVSILFRQMGKRLKEQRNLTLRITPTARQLIAKMGYDHKYGARPLKRLIQSKIEDEMATMILSGEILNGDAVTVSASGKNIKITSKRG